MNKVSIIRKDGKIISKIQLPALSKVKSVDPTQRSDFILQDKLKLTSASQVKSRDIKISLPQIDPPMTEKSALCSNVRFLHSKSKLKRKAEPNLKSYKSCPELPRESSTAPKWYSLTQIGSAGGSPKRHNQDNYLEIPDYFHSKLMLFGVMDGHGHSGHQVSSFISNTLPHCFDNLLRKCNIYSAKLKSLESAEDRLAARTSLREAFLQTNSALLKKPSIDSAFSGSTAVVVLLDRFYCICGNLGDSRAVLANYVNSVWSVVELSKDHKPSNAQERERVEKAGGEIESCKDRNGNNVGPLRVWIKGEKVPGLAMTRSIGDSVAEEAGVLAEPDIAETSVGHCSQIIIIASDGLWEFISNNEAVAVAAKHWGMPKAAAEELLIKATNQWKLNEETVDDITIIVIFLPRLT